MPRRLVDLEELARLYNDALKKAVAHEFDTETNEYGNPWAKRKGQIQQQTGLKKVPSRRRKKTPAKPMRDAHGRFRRAPKEIVSASGFTAYRDFMGRFFKRPGGRRARILHDDGHPLLRDTGKMRRSFRYTSTAHTVEVSNSAPYFQYHQFGTKHMPSRSMLPLAELGIGGTVFEDEIRKAGEKYKNRHGNVRLNRRYKWTYSMDF